MLYYNIHYKIKTCYFFIFSINDFKRENCMHIIDKNSLNINKAT